MRERSKYRSKYRASHTRPPPPPSSYSCIYCLFICFAVWFVSFICFFVFLFVVVVVVVLSTANEQCYMIMKLSFHTGVIYLFQHVKTAILTVQTVSNIVNNDTALQRLHPVMYRQEVVVLIDVKLAGREMTVQKVYTLLL